MSTTLEELQEACYGHAPLPSARDAVEALARFVLAQPDAVSARPTLVILGHALDFLTGQDAWKRGFVEELERWSSAAPEVWPAEIETLGRELAAARELSSLRQKSADQAVQTSALLAAAEARNRDLKASRTERLARLAQYPEESAA